MGLTSKRGEGRDRERDYGSFTFYVLNVPSERNCVIMDGAPVKQSLNSDEEVKTRSKVEVIPSCQFAKGHHSREVQHGERADNQITASCVFIVELL